MEKHPIYYCTVEGTVEEPPVQLKTKIKRNIKPFKIKIPIVVKDGKAVNNLKGSLVLRETIPFSRKAVIKLTKVSRINKEPVGYTNY